MTFLQQQRKNNKENKEKKINDVFEWAEYQLFNANELFAKRKKTVILETASMLEELGVEKQKISTHISNRLSNFVSDAYVREVLKDYPQYKDEKHVKSAQSRVDIHAMTTTQKAQIQIQTQEQDYYNTIICGDALSVLKTFDTNSIDCCVCSPPYWQQRDYEIDGQLGREKSYTEYIDKLVEIFDQVKRVLKDKGSCWIVIADSYNEKNRSLLCIPERLALAMTDKSGWILRSKIIWKKGMRYHPVLKIDLL